MVKTNDALKENNKTLGETIAFLKSGKESYNKITDGFYYYVDEICALGYFVQQEQYNDIYLEGRGKELVSLDPSNFTFEECITYLHHMWIGERLASGWINKQVINGQLLKVVELTKKYINDNFYE